MHLCFLHCSGQKHRHLVWLQELRSVVDGVGVCGPIWAWDLGMCFQIPNALGMGFQWESISRWFSNVAADFGISFSFLTNDVRNFSFLGPQTYVHRQQLFCLKHVKKNWKCHSVIQDSPFVNHNKTVVVGWNSPHSHTPDSPAEPSRSSPTYVQIHTWRLMMADTYAQVPQLYWRAIQSVPIFCAWSIRTRVMILSIRR